MQGMALRDSFEGKPKTLQSPVFLDSENCVFRTSGEKTATMPEKRTEGCLVESNKQNTNLLHGVIMAHPFEKFLGHFIPMFEKKFTQLNKATWILETTGSQDAADLKADLDIELRTLTSDAAIYRQLLDWEKSGEVQDPLLKRQLNVLIRLFKQNQIPQDMLEKLAEKEARLAQNYAQFRPVIDGQKVSENEIRHILKNEKNIEKRKKAWEASKEIGKVIASQILELVELRNSAAHLLGYSDFFQMQLQLQEVDGKWLLDTFDVLFEKSSDAYASILQKIEESQSRHFGLPKNLLGPWAWSDPFAQEDPLDSSAFDALVSDIDIVSSSTSFYDHMGMDVRPILARSDMVERPGKNQHAFCMNVDRKGDVRTLNNVQKSIKWLETTLHEYGHAIYDLGVDLTLPWLLREPPHMITTEAMALLAGRQAYRSSTLPMLVGKSKEKQPLIEKADESLKRRQLIFSRWALVMTAFESELYRNPNQDLNRLWWHYVEKYQKIRKPEGRDNGSDWAAKYHIGLAPVYYFSYLLGEMFASSIQESLEKECGSSQIATKRAGKFLHEKLFSPGNRMDWSGLVQHVTGSALTPDAWIREFAT